MRKAARQMPGGLPRDARSPVWLRHVPDSTLHPAAAARRRDGGIRPVLPFRIAPVTHACKLAGLNIKCPAFFLGLQSARRRGCHANRDLATIAKLEELGKLLLAMEIAMNVRCGLEVAAAHARARMLFSTPAR